jgi:hypothetical protein
VNVTNIHNTYNETVVNNVTVNKVSYNGGPGGTAAAPTAQEKAAAAEPHVPPTAMQHQHTQEAARNPALAARANGGHPAIAATPRPAAFNAPGVVGARGATTSPGSVAHTPTPGQPNGAVRTQGQPGQPNATAHAQGQPGQPNGAARTQGQPGQPNGARPQGQPGQPNGARPQGQPAQANAARPAKPARPKPEEKKGEHEK